MRRARAAGPFEAVAKVVDFGRHVPPQSTVGDRFNSTNSYVHIINRNSIVSIRSAPVSLLAEAGRNLIGTFLRTTKATGVLTAQREMRAPIELASRAATARLKVHVFEDDCIGWTLAG